MKFFIASIICCCLLVTSCKKEEVLTDGQKSAQQIQATLNANPGIKTASFYIGNVSIESNQPFSITDQYVTTATNSYNLSRLIRYQYGSQGIIFYF